jgi:hypothetical protein
MPAYEMNRRKFRQKYLLRLISSPVTLIPVIAGATDLLALWTFSMNSGIGIFTGIAAVLGGLGIFMTRLLTGSDRVAKEIIEEMEKKTILEQEKILDELDQKLMVTNDTRDESCLRDLRVLLKEFTQGHSLSEALNNPSMFDILSGVEQLFNQGVRSLEKSLEFWYTAQKMATPEAREPILAERERIITEVGQATKQLGGILASIGNLADSQNLETPNLKRIQDELDQNLDVAKKVRERMESLNKELDSGV